MPRLFRARGAGGYRKERAELHTVLLRSLWTTSKTRQQGRRLDPVAPGGLSGRHEGLIIARRNHGLSLLYAFRGLVGGVPFENEKTVLTYGTKPEDFW